MASFSLSRTIPKCFSQEYVRVRESTSCECEQERSNPAPGCREEYLQTGVSTFDMEVLLDRIANLKHIWSNQDSNGGVEQGVLSVEDALSDKSDTFKSFTEKDQSVEISSLGEQKSETTAPVPVPSMDQDKKGKLKVRPIRGQNANDSSRLKKLTSHRNSFTVTINSKDDMAASTPLGFRDIILDSSSKARKKDYPKPMVCNFCKNNREVRDIYLTHYLYDPVTKVLACPVLRKHICEICGDTGDNAHTLQYCKLNKARGGAQGNVPKMLCSLSVTNSAGKIRKN